MYRLPLWGAILMEVYLIFIAMGGNIEGYTINQEKIWTTIGINFVFILISIIKRNYSKNKKKEYTRSFVSEERIKIKMQERDPETLFGMALKILQNSKSEKEKKQAVGAIVYAAQNGYQPAVDFIEDLKKFRNQY